MQWWSDRLVAESLSGAAGVFRSFQLPDSSVQAMDGCAKLDELQARNGGIDSVRSHCIMKMSRTQSAEATGRAELPRRMGHGCLRS
jgi:hypothetical protein